MLVNQIKCNKTYDLKEFEDMSISDRIFSLNLAFYKITNQVRIYNRVLSVIENLNFLPTGFPAQETAFISAELVILNTTITRTYSLIIPEPPKYSSGESRSYEKRIIFLKTNNFFGRENYEKYYYKLA